MSADRNCSSLLVIDNDGERQLADVLDKNVKMPAKKLMGAMKDKRAH